MAPFAYDGFEELRGVWGGAPGTVPPYFAHQAINRFFREDRNRTRPSILNIELEFESTDERTFFEAGNGQGAFFYNSYPSFLSPRLACSIGGRIYTVEVQGRTGIVRRLFDGNARQFMHSWFAQGFEFLFVQDGINAPLIWDGTNVPYRSNLVANQIPTGSVMAFIHGRMVVASADGKNRIFVGDIAYGGDTTTTADIIGFTEQDYWAEGGSFDTPIFVGDIMGLYAMPYLDTGTGQNELVVGCTNGFTSLDLSGRRETWIDTQVQRVSLVGSGLVSSHGFCGLNGDMFYRSGDGIATYRNARVEYEQSWRQTPISREVNYWIKPDRLDLLEFIPMVSWQNMVLCGCSPLIEKPSNSCFGYHRFCRGFVVFDADNMSTAGRQGTPVWHGMWTGIRPWEMISGRIGNSQRCFAFSYDRDQKNRLYEITLLDGDDVFEGTPRRIFSMFTSSELGIVQGKTTAFEPKKLNGGMLELSNVLAASTFTIDYRPDGSPCWIEVDQGSPGCNCPTWPSNQCSRVSWPVFSRKYLTAVDGKECVPGTEQPANVFYHAQMRMRMEGSMEVERFSIRMDLQPDAQIAKCLGNTCAPITCCPDEFDYTYHIAPSGKNTKVPTLTCEPPEVTYTSTRYWRAVCPSISGMSVIAQGQGTSTISQADADAKALTAAQLAAALLLEQQGCPACTPQIVAEVIVDGGTVDFSSYFAPGQFPTSIGQPWRIVVVTNNATVVQGVVNNSGTLEISLVFSNYDWSFNTTTKVFTDGGGGSIVLQLQIGCNSGGVIVWPDGDY